MKHNTHRYYFGKSIRVNVNSDKGVRQHVNTNNASVSLVCAGTEFVLLKSAVLLIKSRLKHNGPGNLYLFRKRLHSFLNIMSLVAD